MAKTSPPSMLGMVLMFELSIPGKAEERLKHRKQRAEPVARELLMQMAAARKSSCAKR